MEQRTASIRLAETRWRLVHRKKRNGILAHKELVRTWFFFSLKETRNNGIYSLFFFGIQSTKYILFSPLGYSTNSWIHLHTMLCMDTFFKQLCWYMIHLIDDWITKCTRSHNVNIFSRQLSVSSQVYSFHYPPKGISVSFSPACSTSFVLAIH